MKRLLLPLALLVLPAAAPDPADFAWRMAPGAQLPLDTPLRDETGHALRLRDAFHGRPVILDLGYFHCPTLCGLVRADLMGALRTSALSPDDYDLVSLSIDPAETPADAAAGKTTDLAAAGVNGAAWQYVTGDQSAIDAIASVVGFRARYSAEAKQFLHPTGLVVLGPTGQVSGYLLGMGYAGGDLRAAVLRAGAGAVTQSALPILLLCFHFDATTGRYTLAIEKVLRLMAALTVLTLGGVMFALHRQGPAR